MNSAGISNAQKVNWSSGVLGQRNALSSKRDESEAYDGKDTVLDERPPLASDHRSRARPDHDQQKLKEDDDLEEKATELWAPVAKQLFQEQHTGTENPFDDDELEETDTELAKDPTSPASSEPSLEAADTVEMTPEAAAAAIAEAEAEAARLLSDTVEVCGEEGEAARRLAEEERRQRAHYDPSATQVVEAPSLPKLVRECRMCGRKITKPSAWRLRGPIHGEKGFRCEKCSNIFCAGHVVRVSGLWESLLKGARFRCQLCLPETKKPG